MSRRFIVDKRPSIQVRWELNVNTFQAALQTMPLFGASAEAGLDLARLAEAARHEPAVRHALTFQPRFAAAAADLPRRWRAAWDSHAPPPILYGEQAREARPVAVSGGSILRGVAVSAGVVRGRARVLLHGQPGESMMAGEILVAPFTDPGWTPYFMLAAGLVVDLGGLLSHGSIVARELGLPAVVNVGPATRIIRTGQWLEVDGNTGVVRLLGDYPTA